MCQKTPQHYHPTVSAIKGVTVAICVGRLLDVFRHVRRRTCTQFFFLLPTVAEIVGPRQKLSRDPDYSKHVMQLFVSFLVRLHGVIFWGKFTSIYIIYMGMIEQDTSFLLWSIRIYLSEGYKARQRYIQDESQRCFQPDSKESVAEKRDYSITYKGPLNTRNA